MIYVHRDWSIVPSSVMSELKEAELALDAIKDKKERKEFIKENAHKWAELREYLHKMPHGKCWYSESKDPASRLHVDHFRTHGRSKQAERNYAEGYCWLAFDLDNFRLAAQLCNTVNREYSEETVGKGDWFPLLDASTRATLANRSYSRETSLLLDPTDPDDAESLIFNDTGVPAPAPELNESAQDRVRLAIKYLGLDQSMLNTVRRKLWQDCVRTIRQYNRIARKDKGDRTVEEVATLEELAKQLRGMSRAESWFSAVVRSCLVANRLGKFVVRNELEPISNDF